MKYISAYIAAAIALLASGYMCFFVLIPNLVSYHKFKDAPKVPVTNMIKLERHYRYPVRAKYEYEFGGNVYTGEKFETFRTFTQEDERFLEVMSRKNSESGFYCFVNPDDPSQSVLNNDYDHFTIWMYALGFIGLPFLLGSYLIYCGRYEYRKANQLM